MYAGYSGSYVYYSYIQVILKPLFDNGTITKPVDINSAYFYIRNFATTGSSVTLNGNIARNVWNYQTITCNNRPDSIPKIPGTYGPAGERCLHYQQLA